MMSQRKTTWKDPRGSFHVLRGLFRHFRQLSSGKTPLPGSFQGVFPLDIIDGVYCMFRFSLLQSFSSAETLWLSMMKDFWRRRQEKQWANSIIVVAIKNWRDLDIKHVCNCNREVFKESIADSIRGKLINNASNSDSRNPSQCCSTLYIQRSNERSYGMLLRTCLKNIDEETIHYLWTTCLAKIENMV